MGSNPIPSAQNCQNIPFELIFSLRLSNSYYFKYRPRTRVGGEALLGSVISTITIQGGLRWLPTLCGCGCGCVRSVCSRWLWRSRPPWGLSDAPLSSGRLHWAIRPVAGVPAVASLAVWQHPEMARHGDASESASARLEAAMADELTARRRRVRHVGSGVPLEGAMVVARSENSSTRLMIAGCDAEGASEVADAPDVTEARSAAAMLAAVGADVAKARAAQRSASTSAGQADRTWCLDP